MCRRCKRVTRHLEGYLRGCLRGRKGRGSRINQPLDAVSYRAIKSELKYQFIAGDFIWALGALRRGTVQTIQKKNKFIYTHIVHTICTIDSGSNCS